MAGPTTMAEWRAEVAERTDRPFAPPPFSLFMDETAEVRGTVAFDVGGPDWLSAEVSRLRFGDSFDLVIHSVAVHGPARDAFDLAAAAGDLPSRAMVGTGLFRAFMRAAETSARERSYAAVVCLGVANAPVRAALLRYGYRMFRTDGFRRILRSATVQGPSSGAGSFYRRAIERFGAPGAV